MTRKTDEIDSTLKAFGMRITQARRSVYECLHASDEPLSASDVFSLLQNREILIDLVTIYRTLDTLERCDLLVRVDRLHEGWRYAVRSQDHHHSITCSVCGGISPLDVCELARLEQSLERETGFTNIRHSLQFYGTCPKCQG